MADKNQTTAAPQYEPPRLTKVGAVAKDTLGVGGSKGDGALGQTRP